MAIIHVQEVRGSASTTQTPSAAYGTNITSGNVLIVFVTWGASSGSVISIADSLGTVYTAAGSAAQSTGNGIQGWIGTAPASGANTVTATLNASLAGSGVRIFEFSGVTLTVDGSSANSGTSTSPSSGNFTTTNPGDLLIGSTRGGTISSIESGWTAATGFNGSQYRINPGSVGAFAATWTISVSTAWSAMAFALTPSASPIPTVSAQPITNLNANSVTLNGSISVAGTGGNASVEGFNWGTTVAYGNVASASGSFGVGAFSQNIIGLNPGQTYHYQAFATNPSGTSTTADQTFTVPLF